jgi:galactose mutarotase-like enzyme
MLAGMQVNTGKDTFEYVELVDPSHPSSARIAPSRGGLAYSFIVKGREALALDRDSFTDTTKNVRGGVPVLFPIAGPVKDETYLADGKPFKMKQHGFGRLMPWKLVSTSTSPVPSMTMELTPTEATRASYPWEFVVRYTYELAKDTLTLKQEYTNNSKTPMPVHAGFHPYFKLSDKEKARLEIPASRYQDMIAWTEHPFDGRLDWSKDVIDIVFLDMQKNQAAVVDGVDKVRITLKHDAPFKYVVFWTTKAAQFVCVEPWTGRRFAMNSGEDLIHVKPGDTVKTWCSFSVTPVEG